MPSPQRPALFLDRDGVIIFNVEDRAVKNPVEIRIIPGIVAVIQAAIGLGMRIVVVSNQPDYALGNITLEERSSIEKAFIDKLRSEGITFDGIYYCYHHEKAVHQELRRSCECKKPAPGLLKLAEKDLQIDMPHSFIIGDRASDIRAGKDAGVKTILFDPNKTQGEYLVLHQIMSDFSIQDLSECVALLNQS